jgi:hypothetical protein
MSIGSKFNTITSYEIQAIETFLSGSKTSLATASNRLKQFEPKEITSPDSPKGYYNASTQAEQVYDHYKKRFPVQIEAKKLTDYEQLKHSAITYCEEHDVF